MRTEPKASYRTVQYEYAYRYTPSNHPLQSGDKLKYILFILHSFSTF